MEAAAKGRVKRKTEELAATASGPKKRGRLGLLREKMALAKWSGTVDCCWAAQLSAIPRACYCLFLIYLIQPSM